MFLQDITMYGNSNIIEKSKKIDINIYDEEAEDGYNDINISKYMLFTLKAIFQVYLLISRIKIAKFTI